MISLASEGLVELLPNRGARVARFDVNDIRAFHEALELHQRAVARWAAMRHRPEHLPAIRRERLAFEKAVRLRDADAMIESNRSLHLAIAESCGNGFVTDAYARILTVGLRLSRLVITYEIDQSAAVSSHLEQAVQQHRDMEQTIATRDADAAETLGGSHARLSLDRAVAMLRSTLSGDVTLPRIP